MIQGKIEDIKLLEAPRDAGGRRGDKWAYPVGKFPIICRIDDDNRVVTILAIVSIA
jgi:mRNA-degrading endonuclease RelE of RelBE toxin-antitoxin system